jgi:Zn-dependent dipeptidase, microsomal dipeptidase homolog
MKKFGTVTILLHVFYLLNAQSYQKLHFKSILVDTHNDILTSTFEKKLLFDQPLQGKTHSDLYRMLAGGVDVQVFSVWCDGSFGPGKAFARANQQIDTLYAWVQRNPDKMMIATNASDLKKAVKQHKLAAMMGVEGGHMIEDNLTRLDSLYKRGVRYMTLTWNNSNNWATSAMDESGDKPLPFKGLTPFGKQVVRRMNELGMMVDLSHVGEQTFWDAINTTTKPVIVSHSCVYNICPVFRNLKDEQIKAVGKNGGVIHLNFYSQFVDSNYHSRARAFYQQHRAERDSLVQAHGRSEASDILLEKYHDEANQMRPPLSLLLDHLDYIVKLIGVDHVGLGSDFDGISSTPQQLNDVTDFPVITRELFARGYSKKDIRKILGGNFIRILKANSN